MEILKRISTTFESVRCVMKNKTSSQHMHSFNKNIQSLSTDLMVFGKGNHDQFIRSLAMEGYLALISAKILPVSLQEKRNRLQTIFDKLKVYALRNECLFIFLRIQNLLCYYLIQLEQETAAKDILEGMEEFYEKINISSTVQYVDAEDLFSIEDVAKVKKVNLDKIDKVITNNIQMQAFLYNKWHVPDKYTVYCHTALRRQLELKDGTPQEWALKAARLGNYFTDLNQMRNARHHLAASYHVLRTCHDNYKLIPEEFVQQKMEFEANFLELSHCWVKYGLTLFKLSKKRILTKYFGHGCSAPDLWNIIEMTKTKEKPEESDKEGTSEKNGKGDCSTEQLYKFPTLNLREIEKAVPLDLVTKTDGARKLFTFTHKWLTRAKNYYDFEHNSAQYISCSLQLAELYEHLAFFEKNVDNQYSIQRRRAEVLETLSSLLKNCDNVMPVQIDVIRELSQVQLEMMALNLQKLWREESQVNILNVDSDAESIINSLDSESNKTLTERNLNVTSKNLFLRRMEAATSLNGKLFRFYSELMTPTTISQTSIAAATTKN